MEIDAAEIRIRAERRLGEMLREQKETVGLGQGKRTDLVPKQDQVTTRPTLSDMGIDKKLSSRAQGLTPPHLAPTPPPTAMFVSYHHAIKH